MRLINQPRNLMAKLLFTAAATIAAVAVCCGQARAANVLTQWTFEPEPFLDAAGMNLAAGPIVNASTGTGTATGLHASAATDWSTPSGNGGGNAYSSNTWAVGDYLQFQTSTTGFSNIGLEFLQVGSNTGPRDFKLQYSTDGSTFLDFANNAYVVQPSDTPGWGATAVPAGLDRYMFNLTGISALNEQANVYFRLSVTGTATAGPATGWAPGVEGPIQTGGTSRIDDFTVYSEYDLTPPAAPVLPQAGDIVFGLNTPRSKSSIELVRGPSTAGGGAEPAPFGPWQTMVQRSVRFDNLGGTLHNVQGNLLGVGESAISGTSSSANGGSIWSSATQGTAPFTTPRLLAKTGSVTPTFASMTATRLSGLSVSPDNSKIAVVGTDSGKVLVYDYTAGNGVDQSGAALANARETATSEMTITRTQGTAWLNNSTALALNVDGKLYEAAVDSTSVTTTEKASLTLVDTPTASALYYNTAASQYVWAMLSGFSSTGTNTLYVLDPAANYAVVGTPYSFSLGVGPTFGDTAREIALNADGDLFISTFTTGATSAKIYVLEDAAANAATLNPASTVLWYTSTGVPFSNNNGIDVGFAATGPAAGDYNLDGSVNAADYVVWRKDPGSHGGAGGYDIWRQNFNNPPGSGSGLDSTSSVPEPASVVLLLIGLAAFAGRRRTA
jgi:hypothetical protein